jgi:16S rRNA (guanine527-N7)-methyltransferase
MRSILDQCGVAIGGEALERLWTYHRMLRDANAELNLTRIHNFENMVLKHYVDSLLVLRFGDLPNPLIDMGTGPGLPGIPLAIARPKVHFILADSRRVRTQFVEDVVERLGLENVEVHTGSVGARMAREANGVITRAVSSVDQTLQAAFECLRPGGRVLLMKGPDCDAEIASAARNPEFGLVADHAYQIPGTTHDRRLLIYEKHDVAEEPLDTIARGSSRAISSGANAWFKAARDCLAGPGIRKHGRAIMAGTRVVAEIAEAHPGRVRAWLTDDESPPPPKIAETAAWIRLTPALLKELDLFGTRGPLALVDVPEITPWRDAAEWPRGCSLLVPFQDPENVGAVIRSAAAFGVARVVLLKEAAHPFHPKATRAAGSAVLQLPIERGPSIHELAVKGAPLVALGLEGEPLSATPWPNTFALVAGLEGPGLPESVRSNAQLRRIPIRPAVESLNAAAAVAVALYEWSRGGSLG